MSTTSTQKSEFEIIKQSLQHDVIFAEPFLKDKKLACYRYVQLVKKHGLEISQPGLRPDKGLTWQMTKRRADSEVHK